MLDVNKKGIFLNFKICNLLQVIMIPVLLLLTSIVERVYANLLMILVLSHRIIHSIELL